LILNIQHPEVGRQGFNGDKCFTNTQFPSYGVTVLIIYVFVYVLSFLGFAYGLRQVNDAFKMKEELRATGICGVIAVIPWAIFNGPAKHINADVFPFSTVALLVAVEAAFCGCTIFPLYRSIYKPPQVDDKDVPESLNNLSAILASPSGFENFKKFLTSEFSVENLLFWAEIEKYRKTKEELQKDNNWTAIKEEAENIYHKYVTQEATYQVNLPDVIVKHLHANMKTDLREENLVSPPREEKNKTHRASTVAGTTASQVFVPTVFDLAQHSVFGLMESDSFARYKASDIYREFVHQVELKERKTSLLQAGSLV
jgi:hypothetical protein